MKPKSTIICLTLFWLSGFNVFGQATTSPKRNSDAIYQFVHIDRSLEETITLTEEQSNKLVLAQRKEKAIYVRITEKTFVKLLPKILTDNAELSIPSGKIYVIEDMDHFNFKPVGLDEAVLENKE